MKLSVFSVQDHYPSQKRTLEELYAEVVRQADLAERLGYDTFFVAEHHFHEYGTVPNPAILLSHLAARTTRLRLGTAISILTFHNPLTIAENYSMVDVLSNGRLTLGVGSGYLKHEFAGYGVDAATKRDRFDEHLDLVMRLLHGERVTHHGPYIDLDSVSINVFPIQQDLPVFVAILRKEAAYQLGRQSRRMLFVPYASVEDFEAIGEMMGEFRRGREEAGLSDHRNAVALAMHTHVAETDAEARKIAAEAFDRYVATRLYAKSAVYDDIIESGLALFGSPKTIAEKLLRLRDMGVDHVLTLHNFGLLPEPQVHRSMRMLMREVKTMLDLPPPAKAL
ncbi:LLM class flavin-dependent oxidoreductase [Labrys monachus]|uniref:Alkanesulfonate monooxygenase SsuD/methylene tetrahydromethanopterin reductase-like flavin-dependent oxidoreductase (Luciferase family) n=1 Tax=Labrys monachus TaxID=217067 RepID=A0ABU0FI94_9HYPH|nr:LLM class flavin-dependent oxidoreductase [Labrys monachus]MDQ0394330.1 alkanesulfonate monooxygenase SsuD/methylene tetrahydromethanopterin reductase-like flavin-dependent oxidoreductase (luciferase family) [Labrys monachus]